MEERDELEKQRVQETVWAVDTVNLQDLLWVAHPQY